MQYTNLHPDRKNFGKLVKSIREDMGIRTQDELTDRVNALLADLRKERRELLGINEQEELYNEDSKLRDWNYKKISTIVTGRKENMSIVELKLLAEVLGLTMRERREFFAAGLGVVEWRGTTGSKVAGESKKDVLLRFEDHVRAQLFPSFVVDQYLNVILINASCLEMLKYTEKNLESSDPYVFNLMNILFSKEAASTPLIEDFDDATLLRNIYLFRTQTLRYRHFEYYKNLLDHLKKLPKFRVFWDQSHSPRTLDIGMTEGFSIRAHEEPSLKYSVSFSSALFPYGDLYTTIFSPCNELTQGVFNGWRKNTSLKDVYRLAEWPKIES